MQVRRARRKSRLIKWRRGGRISWKSNSTLVKLAARYQGQSGWRISIEVIQRSILRSSYQYSIRRMEISRIVKVDREYLHFAYSLALLGQQVLCLLACSKPHSAKQTSHPTITHSNPPQPTFPAHHRHRARMEKTFLSFSSPYLAFFWVGWGLPVAILIIKPTTVRTISRRKPSGWWLCSSLQVVCVLTFCTPIELMNRDGVVSLPSNDCTE